MNIFVPTYNAGGAAKIYCQCIESDVKKDQIR